MYDQFYNFIARIVIDYFKSHITRSGEKLELKLNTREEIELLHSAFVRQPESEVFVYKTPESEYKSICVNINATKIIIAAHMEGVQPAFLAGLRNLVGTNNELFKDTGILFIHNSALDTLISGADKLQKEGMPLHYKNIEEHIQRLLNRSSVSEELKAIIQFILSKQSKFSLQSANYLSEYREIIQVLTQGKIDTEQYQTFGLFYDSTLAELNNREIKQRLEQNSKYYELAHNYHELKIEDLALEKDFDKKGTGLITSVEWKTIDYKLLQTSREKQLSITPIEYIEGSNEKAKDGLIYWEKPSSDTTAGKRTRHIVIFNPNKQEEVLFQLEFSKEPKKGQCEIVKGSQVEIKVQGRKLQLKLYSANNTLSYSKIKYKDKKNYEFRVLVVPFSEEHFQNLRACYSLPTKMKDRGLLVQKDEAIFTIGKNTDAIKIVLLQDLDQSVELDLTSTAYTVKSEVDNPDGLPIHINLVIDKIDIPIVLTGEPVKPKPITGAKIDQMKREMKADFTYHYNKETDSIKLFIGNEQYFAQEELYRQLKLEYLMLEKESLNYTLNYDLEINSIEIEDNVRQTYVELLQYYKKRELLPTLATMTTVLKELMISYVQAYKEAIGGIVEGQGLKVRDRNLLKLGTIIDSNREMILWSPLQPLNIAYTLQKYEALKEENVSEELLKRIVPLQLVPYLKDELNHLYRPIEKGIGTWIYFEKYKQSQVRKSDEVSKIIEDTLVTFKNQFKYLFQIKNYPLKLNIIDVGDGKEVIAGILRFLIKQYKVEEQEDITPIILTYYTTQKGRGFLYDIGYDDLLIEEVLRDQLPNIKTVDYPIYIKLLRDQLSIYEGSEHKEAHISFISTNHIEESSYRNMDEIESNFTLDGLVGGLTGYDTSEEYIQTVGMKGVSLNTLLEVIKGTNALAHIGNTSTPYNQHVTLAMITSQNQLNSYERIEHLSDWSVYIEPKANYSYFSGKENSLVHYVNRTTSTGIISAITLSKKVDSYKEAILQRMKKLGISITAEELTPVIELANNLNGEWLVELLSFKKVTHLESFNVVALTKWIKKLLDPTYDYWIPLSLHELLRTCDHMGIRSSTGIFSSKNYERYINDLIWVGYRIDGTQVDIGIYPVSVGLNKEGGNLYRQLEEIIEKQSFESRYFKQMIIQKSMIVGVLLDQFNFFTNKFSLDAEIVRKLNNESFRMTMSHRENQGLQAYVAIVDTYETSLVNDQESLHIQTNLEALWLESFNLQKMPILINQVEKNMSEQKQNYDEVSSESNIEYLVLTENIPVNKSAEEADVSEGELEDVPIDAIYSILYYMEELEEDKLKHIQNYLNQGIKPYLLVKQSQEEFEMFVRNHSINYESLIKQQLLTIIYNVELAESFEEPYIADGLTHGSLFYEAVKQTVFNCEQYEIEHHTVDGNMLIKAGAGTGKTKVMIDRIMYIKHMRPATKLEDIAMITFTNESTMEMRQRLADRMTSYYRLTQDKKYLDWMDELANMTVSTIHAFAKDMLERFGEEIGMSNLQVTSYNYHKKHLIEKAINEFSILYQDQYKTFKLIKHYELTTMILAINNYLDNRGISFTGNGHRIDFGDASSETQFFFEFVLNYVQQQLEITKEKNQAYEMNDLIKKLRNLTQLKDIKEKCKFEYIMVDEFQDTDEVQIEFILWIKKQTQSKLFVVGDSKQSIYRFRGADYTAFKQVEEALQGSIVNKKLVRNYRSDVKLMNQLNQLFGNIAEEIMQFEINHDDLLVGTQSIERAQGIQVVKLEHQEDKFNEIKRLYELHKNEGIVCALVRTNKQVRELAEYMTRIKVPVIAKLKGSFYTHQAIRDFYQLIRVLLHPERSGEWIILDRTIFGEYQFTPQMLSENYSPVENYVGKILKGCSWYQELLEISNRCKTALPLQEIQRLVAKMKVGYKYARYYYSHMLEDEKDNEELKHIALHKGKEYEANINKLFYIFQKTFQDYSLTLECMEQFLEQKIAAERLEESVVLDAKDSLQALRIMTVHQSKGLEFDTVIMPYTKNSFDTTGLNECIVKSMGDHYRLGYHLQTKDRERYFENNYFGEFLDEELEEKKAEETRLFYVACTRAKKDLYPMINLYANKSSQINTWQDLVMRGN